jgi:alkylhydroperoxidase/carboxymuconolactone decarboxylase family protein YurZ
LHGLCREQHAVLVDAGVTSGGGQSAPDGLALMVGGPDDVVERAMPVLNGFARSVIHCGALGTGMAAKLARNAAQYGRWVVLQEAAALAAAAGVSPAVFLRVMEEGADGRDESLTWLRAHRSGVQLSEDQIAGFDAMARKDLAAAQDLAAHLGVEVALTNLTPPRIAAVIRGNTAEPLPDNGFNRGVAMMHTVMGACVADVIRHAPRLPLLRSTVEHLFADIWSRPGLTIRDRRLLVLGATAMLGRTDLLHNQLKGALIAGELTTAQLRELSVFLHYYAGWGNGTAVNTVVENLITNGYGNDDPPAVPGVGG